MATRLKEEAIRLQGLLAKAEERASFAKRRVSEATIEAIKTFQKEENFC